MAMFKGFKPQAMNKIAGAMGYQGDMNQFQQYVDQDPARQQQMNMYTNAARKMAEGGYVPRFNTGGVIGAIDNGSSINVSPEDDDPVFGGPVDPTPEPTPNPAGVRIAAEASLSQVRPGAAGL